jgi:UDPglucose 6-dehydrogenase
MLGGLNGELIGVLGLAFKPQIDDVRDAAALALVDDLLSAGARVRVHDPVAMDNARRQLGDRVTYAAVDDCQAAAAGADACALATEWNAHRV